MQEFQAIEREVSDLRKKCESLEATMETLADREVMAQIEKSIGDIKAGRVRNIDCLIKELEKRQ